MDSRPLWQHQINAIRAAEVNNNLALFFEQGTGKTRTMIEILRRRFAKKGKIVNTLIVCPIIVMENWKREIHMFSKITEDKIYLLKGTGAQRERQLLKLCDDKLGSSIIITNYESMQMKNVLPLIHHWHPEILICDESQRLKSHESVRAKAIAGLADIASARFILTGTPVLQSPMDLYQQFRVLDCGETFGKNFFAFRGAFFVDKNAHRKGTQSYIPDWQPYPEAIDRIKGLVSTKGLRVLKKDCLDLPPFVRQTVNVDLSTEQAKAYKEMKNEYITFLKDKENEPRAVVAQLAVTKALRLQQIVTGFAKDDKGDIHQLDCPRIKVLSELLEDIAATNKVIVWACFQENYRQIREVCQKLGLDYREIHGGINHMDREEGIHAFRTNPGVRVMIANQAAGGVGINLIEAAYSIYYSKSFRLEDDLQSEARNYRGGSHIHTKITRIDIITKGTIDELVSEALANKQNIADSILSWSL
jgi:SNF2 family DNA or RNA helicase